MKKLLLLALCLVLATGLFLGGCSSSEAPNDETQQPGDDQDNGVVTYENGTYRGIYEDRGEQQVSVQFTLEDNVISNLSFRHLAYSGTDYRKLEESDPLSAILEQHNQISEHLEGKSIDAMHDLYSTGDFIEDVDTFTGATLRGNKVFSAMQDALNRGLYSPAGEVTRNIGEYANGTYRGIYGDGGEQQVSIQFTLENNNISDVRFRNLMYKGTNYRQLEESDSLYAILEQHNQIVEYLEGKTLETIFDLYTPGDFIEDVDTFTGATIRGNKVFSAIKDGLNRGLYSPAGEVSREIGEFADGRYRGVFGDSGVQQVGVQFTIENNVFTNFTFRHLYYSGVDYRQLEEGSELYAILEQHEQISEYLVGKSLDAIFDLFTTGEFVEDVDTFTGATIRGNKVVSAIIDALNRGIY